MVDALWSVAALCALVSATGQPPAFDAQVGPNLLVVPHAASVVGPVLAEQAELRLTSQGLVERRIDGAGVLVVRVPPGRTLESFANQLRQTGDYAIVEPDRLVVPASAAAPPINDPLYNKQWHLPHLLAPQAWSLVPTNASAPIVAIVDTGIDTDHPDLSPRLVPGYHSGRRLTQAQGGPIEDINGHGTRCAGIAAATTNNALGVGSLARRARIMPIRTTDLPDGSASLSALYEGIRFAADNGARVVSLSYSGVSSGTAEVMGAYARSKGCLVVWSTDNFDFNFSWFDYPSVMIVAGTSTSDTLITGVSTGTAVDLVAPGSSIYSTAWNGSYNYGSGVSFAAPIVAGTAAMLWEIDPTLTPERVEEILIQTAKDLGTPGDDAVYGAGLVQPFAAASLAIPVQPRSDLNSDGLINSADMLLFFSLYAASSLTVDFDGNGIVNSLDFLAFLQHFSMGT